MVAFVAGPESSYITGANLQIRPARRHIGSGSIIAQALGSGK
jgi:hypothetical protein